MGRPGGRGGGLNPSRVLFASTLEQRQAETGAEVRSRPEPTARDPAAAPAKAAAPAGGGRPPQSPVERDAGWRGSRYVRPRDARRAGLLPEDRDELPDDGVDDLYR